MLGRLARAYIRVAPTAWQQLFSHGPDGRSLIGFPGPPHAHPAARIPAPSTSRLPPTPAGGQPRGECNRFRDVTTADTGNRIVWEGAAVPAAPLVPCASCTGSSTHTPRAARGDTAHPHTHTPPEHTRTAYTRRDETTHPPRAQSRTLAGMRTVALEHQRALTTHHLRPRMVTPPCTRRRSTSGDPPGHNRHHPHRYAHVRQRGTHQRVTRERAALRLRSHIRTPLSSTVERDKPGTNECLRTGPSALRQPTSR